MSSGPIADYALLSDCRSTALVSRAGSIDWLCAGRFDAPALFARLLDEAAGHWSIAPGGERTVQRRYLPQTLIIETTFETSSGVVVLTDAMAVARFDELTVDNPPQVLVRRVACTRGELEIDVDFRPRPEFGLVHPALSVCDGGARGQGGALRLVLSSSAPLTVRGSSAFGRLRLREGDVHAFSLRHVPLWTPWPDTDAPDDIDAMLRRTAGAWRDAESEMDYEPGPWRELVEQSQRVLRALTFAPTGAIIASPTTSLPEVVGGHRNWDYRYSWVRDASLILDALGARVARREAIRFCAFLTHTALAQVQRGANLQVLFGVGGEHDVNERELPHLAGWRKSRPVRVGNAASRQRQLDVYGDVFDAVHRLAHAGAWSVLDDNERAFLVDLADLAARHWTEPDSSIWEVRGEKRHFVYSKLMCWVALDHAVRLAKELDAQDRVAHWSAARDEIRAAILERGWSDRAASFTRAFGSDELDASNLRMAILGFLDPADPRLLATIAAAVDRLTDARGLVYRYRAEDGLGGNEGAFLVCTFWLAHAQAIVGDLPAARATFERAARHANDVGLLAEQVSGTTGELLGNFPQGLSHVGLLNAAYAIASGGQPGRRRGADSHPRDTTEERPGTVDVSSQSRGTKVR